MYRRFGKNGFDSFSNCRTYFKCVYFLCTNRTTNHSYSFRLVSNRQL